MEKEKIISIEDRIPKLKTERKKKANRKLLFYLIIFFILISIIIYLQSPLSNVKKIVVTGNEVIPAEEIIDISGISTDHNIWNVSVKDIDRKISEHPLIKNSEIDRQLPNTIKINVVEQKVVGYVEKADKLHPLSEDGVVIPYSDLVHYGDAPFISNFDDEQYLTRLTAELKETPDHILNLISEIIWSPTEKNKYKIILYMDDGFIVHATIRDFASKIKAYPSIVSQLDPDKQAIVHMDVGIYVEQLKK